MFSSLPTRHLPSIGVFDKLGPQLPKRPQPLSTMFLKAPVADLREADRRMTDKEKM